MCGIVGVIGAIQVKHESMFKTMLQLDVVRGPHSTGIAAITGKGDVLVAKKAMLPQDLLQTRESSEIFKSQLRCLIGHNRWTTHGATNNVNAHPFDMETLVGVHNGGVDKWRFDDHKDFDVDSEALFNAIDLNGLDATIPKINGKYSLSWYDKDQEQMYLLRNKERPMTIAFAKDTDTMFFASEAWMIIVAANREGVELADKPVDTEIGSLYTFNIFESVKDFDKEENKVVEKKVLTTYTNRSYGGTSVVNGAQNKVTQAIANRSTGGAASKIPFAKDIESGTVLTFKCSAFIASAASSYIIGKTEDDIPVRIPVPSTAEELKNTIMSLKSVWGKVVGYCAPQDVSKQYLIIDINSVTELLEDDDDKVEDSYKTCGIQVHRAVFNNTSMTDACCQWCGDPLMFEDKPMYAGRYNGKDGYVCSSCEEIDEVRSYIGL